LYFVGVVVIVMLGIMLTSALLFGGGLLVFLGLVALVSMVAAILFLAVRASLFVQPISLENVGGSVGFGRSWRLVSGSGWRVFGYVLFVALVAALISALVGALVGAFLALFLGTTLETTAGSIVQAGLAIVISPLGPIVMTLLYYDLRWHHGETAPAPGGGEIAGRPQPQARPYDAR